jgi:uncharacterized membrane protein
MRIDALLTIVGMALVTYATRSGGLWLMARVTPSPGVERWLRQIPGAVLVSLVAPAVFTGGPAGLVASAVTIFVAGRFGNMLLAMGAGVGVMWALQALL